MIPALLFLSITSGFSEHPDSALAHIETRKDLIMSAAKSFNLNSKYLKAIVFTERTLNVDWMDEALDKILAVAGKNSSIGFCQVKLKTAYFIECILSDSSSPYYPGSEYKTLMHKSKGPSELINKLENDSFNILYAAAYIRIIQSYWSDAGYPVDERPEIIGTLYSTGLFLKDGDVRKPNVNPSPNHFGLKVMEAIHLFQ